MEFDRYKELVQHYFDTDNREINYQNRVIIPFLEELFAEKGYEVVDSSTLYSNMSSIGRDRFAGSYTPDVLIAKNWKLKKEPEDSTVYKALIEVKTPNAGDRKHAEEEIKEYIGKNPKAVILTDCITWEIYTDFCQKTKDEITYKRTVFCLEAEHKIQYDFRKGKRSDSYPKGVCENSMKRTIKWDEEAWGKLCKALYKTI